MTGAAAAKAIYERFHSEAPNRVVRMNVPAPKASMSEIGVVEEIVYSIPRDLPSKKAGRYRHAFGDTGLGDTGAKPLLLTDGTPGVLTIKSKPGEEPFTIENWLIG